MAQSSDTPTRPAPPPLPPRAIHRGTPAYPPRLEELPRPPPSLWVAGPLRRSPAVAIVGTREPLQGSEDFARSLAGAIARAGGVVLSGGALGIDGAAHRGALAHGGRTCVVAPTGCEHVFPPQHAGLFRDVRAMGGTMIWPFAPERDKSRPAFFVRNGILVALADAVVVVQAGIPSGALNAASWARRLGRPLWVVAGAPWLAEFAGSNAELARGGTRLFTTTDALLAAVGLQAGRSPTPTARAGAGSDPARPHTLALPLPPRPLTPDEKSVVNAVGAHPRHADEISLRSGLPAAAVLRLLLTLALENVVEEGPGGFFRRSSPL